MPVAATGMAMTLVPGSAYVAPPPVHEYGGPAYYGAPVYAGGGYARGPGSNGHDEDWRRRAWQSNAADSPQASYQRQEQENAAKYQQQVQQNQAIVQQNAARYQQQVQQNTAIYQRQLLEAQQRKALD
jgi:hypothetical protein